VLYNAFLIETIRYYQRRGLVDEPYKPLGGQRRYAPSAGSRVRFIKRAQQLGFTLEEVTSLLCRTLKVLIAECARGQRPRSCPIIATLSADRGE